MNKHKFGNEEDLWKDFLNGNDNSLEKIYRIYFDELYNYGNKWLKNLSLTEDSIQDLFIKLAASVRVSRTIFINSSMPLYCLLCETMCNKKNSKLLNAFRDTNLGRGNAEGYLNGFSSCMQFDRGSVFCTPFYFLLKNNA